MKLKILSTIAAISATATSASSLTCGDVQALYQDGACCSANSQSCVKSLSIAAGTSELTLTNTGELSLDLTSITDFYDTSLVSETNLALKADASALTSGLAGKLDTSVLDASAETGEDGVTFAKVLKYVRFDGALQANSDVTLNGAVTFGANAKLGRDALKSNEYLPSDLLSYCTNPTANYGHGFHSVWSTGWTQGSNSATGGWEMHLQAAKLAPNSYPCLVRQIDFGNAELWTNNVVYSQGNAVTSDSRIKKDIVDVDIEDTLQKVRDIELKEYGYTNPEQAGEKTVGFIAQQVKEVYPDAIKIGTKETTIFNEAGEMVQISDLHRVMKDKIFALHHGAIQSLDAKIAALEARLAALEA